MANTYMQEQQTTEKKNNRVELNQGDFNQPLPFEDNSQGEIYATHILQRVDDVYKFMDEAWRILKKDGLLNISAPYYTSVRATQDPTHKRLISEASFVYFSKKWRQANNIPGDIKCDLEIVSINHAVSQEYQGKSQEALQYAIQHYWNVVSDIIVVLKKV